MEGETKKDRDASRKTHRESKFEGREKGSFIEEEY